VSPAELPRSELERAAFVHREFVQLLLLVSIAIAGFVVTRAVAASNREMSLHDAADWYHRGEGAVAAGRVDEAIEAFRRAAARDRTDSRYMLALARALALRHDDEAARNVLLTLREAAPESTEINLELARLAAHRADVSEALRFYHNALYAPWPPDAMADRRNVRLELIRFLLAHDQSGRALSELLAAAGDLPDTPRMHVEVGQLFATAGDYGHSLDQFKQALRLSPDDGEALAGAGRAAFLMARYAVAQDYLRHAPAQIDGVTRTREVVDLILSTDPLAARLGSAERRRRLTSNLSSMRQRLAACDARPGAEPPNAKSTLAQQLNQFSGPLAAPRPLEQDTIEMGVDLIARVAAHVAAACGPEAPMDQAMILIGRQHADNR
jgi:tetratricopeptide (TPR) repeat protein